MKPLTGRRMISSVSRRTFGARHRPALEQQMAGHRRAALIRRAPSAVAAAGDRDVRQLAGLP